MSEQRLEYYFKDDYTGESMPHTINLSLNNYCFMKCRMCDIGQSRANRKDKDMFFNNRAAGGGKAYTLPLEIVKKLIDDVAPYKTIIRPNFVEPLLRADIDEIAGYVTSKGLDFYIITNGYLLSKKAKTLVEAGMRVLRVSIDGTKDRHNEIRGLPDSFQRSIKGIEIVIEEKKRLGLEYPLIGICFTISDHNYDNLLDFYRELDSLGIAKEIYIAFNFLRYSTMEEAQTQNALFPQFFPLTQSSISCIDVEDIDTEELCRQIKAVRDEFAPDSYKYHFNPHLNDDEIKKWFDKKTYLHPEIPCFAPWTVAQVFYDGTVGVNGRCVSPSFGNIIDKPFHEIWNSEQARDFRMKLRKTPIMPVCNRCCRTFKVDDEKKD